MNNQYSLYSIHQQPLNIKSNIEIYIYMIKHILSIVLIICSSAATADDDHDQAKQLLDSGDILPLEIILKKVRSIQPGKILDLELEKEDGQIIYEIELLTTSGSVFELKINAKTAELISTEKEH